MKLAHGFCDLNIPVTDKTVLKQTVLRALSIGYQTVAINTEVADTISEEKKKKKVVVPHIPSPTELTLTKNDLHMHKITREPVILTRITVKYSEPGSPFLSKFRDVIKKYDIVAFTPTSEDALKQIVSQNLVKVDIISLALWEDWNRFPHKIMRVAVKKDIYYEICYGPCVMNSKTRQQTISLGHTLHRKIRSANVIVSSHAKVPEELRHPYDVMNLGRFFGLTEAGAKEALVSLSHNVVYCAAARKKGMSKCLAQVTVLSQGKRKRKFAGLESAAKYSRVH